MERVEVVHSCSQEHFSREGRGREGGGEVVRATANDALSELRGLAVNSAIRTEVSAYLLPAYSRSASCFVFLRTAEMLGIA